MAIRVPFAIVVVLLAGVLAWPAGGDERAVEPDRIDRAIESGVAFLLERQEGEPRAEWPYEGVYRVRGRIPIGYRVGGTGIVGRTMLQTPGFADDEDRQASVERATRFVTTSIEHPRMKFPFRGSYDVRGWGYAYGLDFLLALERAGEVPEDLAPDVKRAIAFFIDGLEATAIPDAGGWNYARRAGFDAPGRSSPFMTGSTLIALFAAIEQGYEVDPAVVRSGLGALESARVPSGAFVYAGTNGSGENTQVPGAIGRMLVSECTLHLADRAGVDRVRAAIDAFLVHWEWLEQRRAKDKTHLPPYGIAPYYFFYAHYFAAQAIELLPERERVEYRRRLHDLIFSVEDEDGTWNDRVFPRSAAYGTAMVLQSLMMPGAERPAGWDEPVGTNAP